MTKHYTIGLYETVHTPAPERRGKLCCWLLIGGPFSQRWEASSLATASLNKSTTEIDGTAWRCVLSYAVVAQELRHYGLERVLIGCAQTTFAAGGV